MLRTVRKRRVFLSLLLSLAMVMGYMANPLLAVPGTSQEGEVYAGISNWYMVGQEIEGDHVCGTTVLRGSSVQLSVDVLAEQPGQEVPVLSYQWYYYDDTTYEYVAIPGANDPFLNVASVPEDASYLCEGYDSGSDRTDSVPFNLYVPSGWEVSVSDAQIPSAGTTATLQVYWQLDPLVAADLNLSWSDFGDLSYQWSKKVVDEDGYAALDDDWQPIYEDIEGATSSSLEVSEPGDYRCRVSEANYGSVEYANARVTKSAGWSLENEYVQKFVTAPGKSVALELPLLFDEGATAETLGLSYSWHIWDDHACIFVEIPEAQGSSYRVDSVDPPELYACLITDRTGQQASVAFELLQVDPETDPDLYDQTVAEEIADVINALPAEIGLEDETAVNAARKAYDALTDAQKAKISAATLAKLEAAEKRIRELKDPTVSISGATVSGIAAKTYNGKAQTQAPKLVLGGKTLTAGTDYSLSYKNNVKAGTATLIISGKGAYKDSISRSFTIKKAKNPLTVNAKKPKVKASKLKKKAQTIKKAKAFTIKKAQGKLSFKKVSGNKKIKINKKNGKISVKKGLKKGTYKVKVKLTAAGNANYKAGSKTVTLKIKVK